MRLSRDTTTSTTTTHKSPSGSLPPQKLCLHTNRIRVVHAKNELRHDASVSALATSACRSKVALGFSRLCASRARVCVWLCVCTARIWFVRVCVVWKGILWELCVVAPFCCHTNTNFWHMHHAKVSVLDRGVGRAFVIIRCVCFSSETYGILCVVLSPIEFFCVCVCVRAYGLIFVWH